MSDPEINDEDYTFTLETPLRYGTKSGDMETAVTVILSPPKTRNSRECAALKQAFFRAAGEQEEDGGTTDLPLTGESTSDPSGVGVITVIAMSKTVDLPDVMEVARKLFSSGVALVEGTSKLTAKLIEGMSQDDFERMLGEYLVNFTLASALAQAKKTSVKA